MTIGTPYLAGHGSTTGTGQVQVTLTQPIPAGHTVIVLVDNDASVLASGVTDSAGNTYTYQFGRVWPSNPLQQVYNAHAATALAAGDTVTATWNTTRACDATVIACAGLANVNGLPGAAATGYTTAASLTVATRRLPSSPELMVAFWTARAAQGAPALVPGAGWSSLAAYQGTANTHYVNAAWKLADTTEPVIAQATAPQAPGPGWGCVLFGLREQPAGTATLPAGGTVTASSGAKVPGTATLHAGGTLAQPGPAAPPPPAWPSFPAGAHPAPGDFASWVTGVFAYLTRGIVMRAEAASSQSLPASTWTPLQFPAPDEDPHGGWSTAGGSVQPAYSWLAPYTGWFTVTVRWLAPASGSGARAAAVSLSGGEPQTTGSVVPSPTGQHSGAAASVTVPMIGGVDYVQALAWTSAAVSTSTGASVAPSIEITAAAVDMLPAEEAQLTSYLPLTGGTVTGRVTFNGGITLPGGAGTGLELVSDSAGNATWGVRAARVTTLTASSGAYTPDPGATDIAVIDTPTAAFTVADPSGAPADGDQLIIRIRSGATAYTPTWGSGYAGGANTPLPSSCTASAADVLGFAYDATSGLWFLLAYAPGYPLS